MEGRFSGGLSLLANNTWKRQMGVRGHDDYTVMLTDNIRHNYGPEDAPHQSITSWVWELPFGPGHTFAGGTGGVLGQIIDGRQVNEIALLRLGNHLGTRRSVGNGVGSRVGNKLDATGQPGQRRVKHAEVVQHRCVRWTASHPLEERWRGADYGAGGRELRHLSVQVDTDCRVDLDSDPL